ncbi:hypothetical protein NQ318_003992, partial [Aromia moschata]
SGLEETNCSTLILTHVLFRHGFRTPDSYELYPLDPYLDYQYFPFGRGQLTNRGKRREFSVGKALRQRYDQFLGEYYFPGIMEAFSSDMDRTKMSLELVLAALFPSRDMEKWNEGEWQPTPFNYSDKLKDPSKQPYLQLLLGGLCPNFRKMYDSVMNLPEVREDVMKYNFEIQYISDNAGKNMEPYYDLYILYFGLTAEVDWGFELPPWTNAVYPDFLRSMVIKQYLTMARTTKMVQMVSGLLLKKILFDTIYKIVNTNDRKIYLYSGHEANIALLLIILGLFDKPHVPPCGAYLIFEVHMLDNYYGIQIYYQNYTTDVPQLLKLPNCEDLCPLDQFEAIVERYLPTQDISC